MEGSLVSVMGGNAVDSGRVESHKKGYVTLPADAGHEKATLELAQKWGADAIRDSDGTRLSHEILGMGYDIYSTIRLVRADQRWPREHSEHAGAKYLVSAPVMTVDNRVEIYLLESYSTWFAVHRNDD